MTDLHPERGGRPKLVFLPVPDFYVIPASTLRNWADAVASAVPGLDVVVVEPGDDPGPELAVADAAFGVLTPPLLAGAPRLRWLQAPAVAPLEPFFFDALVESDVVVTSLRGVYRENLADHVMALVLSFARRLPAFADAQRSRAWRNDLGPSIVDLGAMRMLIVGVGTVGTELAKRARAFGITVVGVDADPAGGEAPLDAVHAPDALDEQLARADWVILTVPDNPQTHHLMSREQFDAMRSSAFFVNVGRGGTVDTDALVAALERGELAGAALDVFEAEPLPADHPLWDRPGVVITPHVAGWGKDTDAERCALIVDNASRFVAGNPLRNVMDKRLRY
jgi:phosphoglycerate dehydrogenase-like enzyme